MPPVKGKQSISSRHLISVYYSWTVQTGWLIQLTIPRQGFTSEAQTRIAMCLLSVRRLLWKSIYVQPPKNRRLVFIIIIYAGTWLEITLRNKCNWCQNFIFMYYLMYHWNISIKHRSNVGIIYLSCLLLLYCALLLCKHQYTGSWSLYGISQALLLLSISYLCLVTPWNESVHSVPWH